MKLTRTEMGDLALAYVVPAVITEIGKERKNPLPPNYVEEKARVIVLATGEGSAVDDVIAFGKGIINRNLNSVLDMEKQRSIAIILFKYQLLHNNVDGVQFGPTLFRQSGNLARKLRVTTEKMNEFLTVMYAEIVAKQLSTVIQLS